MQWKILLALAIILVAAMAMVSRTPEVATFFGYYYSFISQSPPNVSFTLSASSYNNITFTSVNSTVEIAPESMSLSIAGGAVSSGNVSLSGFRGTVAARDNAAVIDGTVRTVTAGNAVFVYDNARITGTISFRRIYAVNVSLPLLTSEINGSIVVKGAAITLNNDTVKLVSPVGNITLDNGLVMSGFAKRIELPKAGIIATE